MDFYVDGVRSSLLSVISSPGAVEAPKAPGARFTSAYLLRSVVS